MFSKNVQMPNIVSSEMAVPSSIILTYGLKVIYMKFERVTFRNNNYCAGIVNETLKGLSVGVMKHLLFERWLGLSLPSRLYLFSKVGVNLLNDFHAAIMSTLLTFFMEIHAET